MFLRVCVDLDQQGQPCGWSWEHRTEAGPLRVHVGPWPGPFDTPAEAFADACRSALDSVGFQMPLFE